MKNLILILAMISMSGCGSDSGDGSTTIGETCGKDITSAWETRATEPIDFAIDFSDFTIGFTKAMDLEFASGEVCRFDTKIEGTDCSGEIKTSNASYIGGGSGDPGCSDFNGTREYDINIITMEMCLNNDCTDFR